jgi:hypothetical protein
MKRLLRESIYLFGRVAETNLGLILISFSDIEKLKIQKSTQILESARISIT